MSASVLGKQLAVMLYLDLCKVFQNGLDVYIPYVIYYLITIALGAGISV